MATLIMLRHAKSDYPIGVPDHDRPLSKRGRTNARTIAARMSEFISPDARLGAAISTALRAQQTWSILEAGLPAVDHQWNDSALYLAEPATIAECARAFTTDVGIIVGHNPGIEELARSVAPATPDIGAALADKFSTASFAVLDTGGAPLSDWQPAHAHCVGFVTCR